MNTVFKPSAIVATSLRLNAKAADANGIALVLEQRALNRGDQEVVVEVRAAAVNPSDVKAAMGHMPYAVFPRTPGRDFAGIVVDGPTHLLGKDVFGSSGDLGIRRDGTHASHLVVEAEALVEKPSNLTFDEAAGVGVPFVTAQEGLMRAGMPGPQDTVLIMGLNGKVGQATAQIASACGAQVIGVVRKPEGYEGFACRPVIVLDSSSADVASRVRELTGGRGASVVFNTVGEPYYEAGTDSLAVGGRQIFIASLTQQANFNIFKFFRGRHSYFGIDTLALNSVASAERLRALTSGFANGSLKPFPVLSHAVYPFSRASEAYVAVIGWSRDRIVLRPEA